MPTPAPHADPAADPLGAIREQERAIAAMQGQRTRMLGDLAAAGEDNEFLPEELAAELGCSPVAARTRLHQARRLCERLPGTVDALCAGQIDWAKAAAMEEITAPLSAEQAREVETWTLARAAGKARAAFNACARRRVLRVDPQGAAKRAATRREDRRIWQRDLDDGMAEIGMALPAEVASAAWDRIDRLARQAIGDGRSLDAARADVAADLLLGRHVGAGMAVRVNVTVDMLTLMGLRDRPAEVHGYGPLDASTARDLAADATWRRIVTDPVNGTIVDVGRQSYRPPSDLADRVKLRDATCVFPGCRRSAESADLDHTRAWHVGGGTSEGNLGPLCRRHHRMKNERSWSLDQPSPGHFRWTSPRGKTYPVEPEPPDETDEPPPF